MNHKVSITHISNEHNDWLRSLDFYKQEIGILKNRLEEVAGKNTENTVAAQVEHFQNQFIIQTDNIDTLRHNINENLSKISTQAEAGVGYVEKELAEEHNNHRDSFMSTEHTINGLRHDFNRFAAQWM
jgi:hypothetical protein